MLFDSVPDKAVLAPGKMAILPSREVAYVRVMCGLVRDFGSIRTCWSMNLSCSIVSLGTSDMIGARRDLEPPVDVNVETRELLLNTA